MSHLKRLEFKRCHAENIFAELVYHGTDMEVVYEPWQVDTVCLSHKSAQSQIEADYPDALIRLSARACEHPNGNPTLRIDANLECLLGSAVEAELHLMPLPDPYGLGQLQSLVLHDYDWDELRDWLVENLDYLPRRVVAKVKFCPETIELDLDALDRIHDAAALEYCILEPEAWDFPGPVKWGKLWIAPQRSGPTFDLADRDDLRTLCERGALYLNVRRPCPAANEAGPFPAWTGAEPMRAILAQPLWEWQDSPRILLGDYQDWLEIVQYVQRNRYLFEHAFVHVPTALVALEKALPPEEKERLRAACGAELLNRLWEKGDSMINCHQLSVVCGNTRVHVAPLECDCGRELVLETDGQWTLTKRSPAFEEEEEEEWF